MDDTQQRIQAALAGRYEVQRELARGGMATVYLAHDARHGRDVALKVLRPELAAAIGTERFLREIRVAAGLQHPNVLTLHDSGEADGLLYYVMPFVQGPTLSEHLKEKGPLPIEEALRLGRRVAEALAHAHERGLVHRDVKPGNVLLSQGQPMVADFGLATSGGAEDANLTQPGVVMGTPFYMAPEQVEGGAVDARSDVYALGCVLFEMLAGSPPFTGDSTAATLGRHLREPPPALRTLRADAPDAVEALVGRALAKDPDQRFAHAGELADALALAERELHAGAGAAVGRRGTRRVLAVAGVLVVALAVVVLWMVSQKRERAWVDDVALPGIEAAVEAREFQSALDLARKVAAIDPQNSRLEALWTTFSEEVEIATEPAGAAVSYRAIDADEATPWIEAGTTPFTARLPHGFQRFRFAKPGYMTSEIASHWYYLRGQTTALAKEGEVPPDMVYVPGGVATLNIPGLDHIDDVALVGMLLSRHEVTNAEFDTFVQAGGYQDERWWSEPRVSAGVELTLDQARERFVDATGRLGPATWEAGRPPEGQDQHPVAGVSWYEAMAFARWAGRTLPSAFHWNRAAETRLSEMVVPKSNFAGEGTAPVGSYPGLTAFGLADMAGNVREWCLNPTSKGERAILGGGHDDLPYMFNDFFALDPWDRSAANGLRTAQYLEELGEAVAGPIDPPFRDFLAEQPVSDEIFTVYRNLYRYDPAPLNAEVLLTDDEHPDYTVRKVAYDLPYGNERGAAWVYLPKRGQSPHPGLVYFPGSNAIHQESSDGLVKPWFDWVIKAGYALVHPIYYGTYERGTELDSDYPDESQLYFDHVVAWGKDLSRGLDYLSSLAEVDGERLGYFGVSWGGAMAPQMIAIEPRIRAAALLVAGFCFQRSRPEVDALNYVTRVTVPVLMMNGRYDHFFPVETSQRPLFEMLGTPPERKRWFLTEGGHNVPREDMMRETLEWMGRHLGPASK
jgi:formylglycine-generating enzyme required for sulfatase activity/dienelactone hydrolase